MTAWKRVSSARWTLCVTALVLVALVGCNSSNGSDGDGGNADASNARCIGGPDPYTSIETALDLTAGQEVEGYICPRRDVDYYKIVVPSGHRLLNVRLQLNAPTSNLDLTYRLMKDAETGAGTAPSAQNNNFDALHCIEPGTYYLQVADSTSNNEDARNAYRLSYSTEPDPDSAEPANDVYENAIDIGSAASGQQGLISCTGDADYYKVTVAANQLLEISLTASETPVDLKYTVLEKAVDENGQPTGQLTPLFSDNVDNGLQAKTELTSIATVPQPETYYIRIEDAEGNDADTQTAYTVTATQKPEPDANDVTGGRNDHPHSTTPAHRATAVSLSASGGCWQTPAAGVPGRIASRADTDYFLVNDPTGGVLSTIEVGLSYSGADVTPQVALVYQTDKSCTEDQCCRVIDDPSDAFCSTAMQCVDSSFVCQAKGVAYCARAACVDPEGGASNICESEKKCAGSVTCIQSSRRCGAVQFFQDTAQGDFRVAHPLKHAGPWYLRVTDLGGDDYNYDAEYRLHVKICPVPTGDSDQEWDNGYFPRLQTNFAPCTGRDCDPKVVAEDLSPSVIEGFFDDTEDRRHLGNIGGAPRSTGDPPAPDPHSFPWTDTSWITGTISYLHDTDHFSFDNPCKAYQGQMDREICFLQAEYGATGSGCPSGTNGSGLEFVINVYTGDGAATLLPNMGDLGGTQTLGYDSSNTGECRIMMRGGGDNRIRVDVSDLNHNSWSPTCKYRVRFRVSHEGCPAPPCKIRSDTDQCFFGN